MAKALAPAMLQVAEKQLDRQECLVLRLDDDFDIGMRAGQGHRATRAGIARIEVRRRPPLAQEGLGETQREAAFSHSRRTAKEKAARQPIPRHGPAELFHYVVVSFNAVPGHG